MLTFEPQAEQTQPYENLTIEKAKELISRGASVTWEDLNKYRYIYTMNLTSKEPKEAYFDIDGRTSFMVSGEIGKTITRMLLVTDSGETLLWVAER